MTELLIELSIVFVFQYSVYIHIFKDLARIHLIYPYKLATIGLARTTALRSKNANLKWLK